MAKLLGLPHDARPAYDSQAVGLSPTDDAEVATASSITEAVAASTGLEAAGSDANLLPHNHDEDNDDHDHNHDLNHDNDIHSSTSSISHSSRQH